MYGIVERKSCTSNIVEETAEYGNFNQFSSEQTSLGNDLCKLQLMVKRSYPVHM
jgi:hypothetical protein